MAWPLVPAIKLPPWVFRRVGPPLGATLVLALVTRYLQVTSRKEREVETKRRISKARHQVQELLPGLHLLATDPAACESTAELARRFSTVVAQLSQILLRSGQELQQTLAGEAERAADAMEEDDKAVAEFCGAWCEVGQAKKMLSTKMSELKVSLESLAAEAEVERAKRQAEALQVLDALVLAEAEDPVMQPSSRRIARLFGGMEPAPELEKARLQRLEDQRASAEITFKDISERSDEARRRGSDAIAKAVEEARQLAKPVGERVVTLQPNCRDAAEDATRDIDEPSTHKPLRPKARTRTREMGDLVKKLSNKMVTAEGRQQLREAEAEVDALAQEEARKNSPSKPCKEAEDVDRLAPPLDKISDTVWRIRGLYEHQVLKMGLRALDQAWPTDDLHSFPRAKDGSCLLFRERLMGELLKATIRLQSITQNDIAAAQRDLPHMSLRQLLRLRVLHLDFTPSGAGSDTVTGVGGTHEAFLTKLDSMLFRQLGCKATGLPPSSSPVDAGEEHRLGCDAVLMVSAARALASPSSWCWWLTDKRRVFFDPLRFQSTETFPEMGVLEVTHLSKADRHEPTGRLRWFDWRVELISTEPSLSPVPLVGGLVISSKVEDLDSEVDYQSAPSSRNGSPTKSKSLSVGAATASMMSADVLRGALGSLRKTGMVDELGIDSEVARQADRAVEPLEDRSSNSREEAVEEDCVKEKKSTSKAGADNPRKESEVATSPRKQAPQQGPPSGIGLSVDLLSGARRSLRKTGSRAAAEAADEPTVGAEQW